jgi:dolichol-phosphate mannosyltransferase
MAPISRPRPIRVHDRRIPVDLQEREARQSVAIMRRLVDKGPAMQNSAPQLSVVVPCFDEEDSLPEFWERTSEACRIATGDSHEIVLVDDGSSDRTWSIIERLAEQDAHVVGVRLFRNHGHQLAVTAGLAICRGARVMLIDADLQDPPELLSPMMKLMDAGADVVYGKRSVRAGESWFKRATAAAFYRLLSHLTDVPIPRDTGDFRLMTRRVVDILNQMPERHRFLRGMVSWIGGRQVAFEYERQARFAGTSKYPLRKMLRFAVDAVTSFSTKPLRIAVWLGLIVSILALLLLVYATLCWITGKVVPGWTSSLVSNTFFAGIQLLILGIMGEYLGRMVEAQKGRPLFTIDRIHTGGQTYSGGAGFSTDEQAERSLVP